MRAINQPTTNQQTIQLQRALQELRRVFYFYFYEFLVDSTLATRRIGEQKFSRLQFASSAHSFFSNHGSTHIPQHGIGSDGNFFVFVQIQYWYQ